MTKNIFRVLVALAVGLALVPVAPAAGATIPKSVCIDPGHGGSDTGTSNTGAAGTIVEKDLNLDVARRIGDLLAIGGYGVSYTRTADKDLTNTQRAQFCNTTKANILVSIHHNGSSDHAVDYSQALFQKRVDRDLARAIVDAVSPALGTSNKGIGQFASGVLIKSAMPATISEGYFLTNTVEYDRLNDPTREYRQEEARAIYNGIVAYLGGP